MVLLRAVQGYERASDRVGYCREGGIRLKAMEEVRKLRQQLTNTSISNNFKFFLTFIAILSMHLRYEKLNFLPSYSNKIVLLLLL